MTKLIPRPTNLTILQRIAAANNLFDILSLRGSVADYIEGIADLMEDGIISVSNADRLVTETENTFRRKMCQLNTATWN